MRVGRVLRAVQATRRRHIGAIDASSSTVPATAHRFTTNYRGDGGFKELVGKAAPAPAPRSRSRAGIGGSKEGRFPSGADILSDNDDTEVVGIDGSDEGGSSDSSGIMPVNMDGCRT